MNARVNFPFHRLRDGDVIEAGNVVIRVLHTPGHTLDSVCLTVTDKRRGAGLSGKPSSTIGFEKRFNLGLRIGDRDEFARYLTSEIPPRPADMDRIVAVNIAA